MYIYINKKIFNNSLEYINKVKQTNKQINNQENK